MPPSVGNFRRRRSTSASSIRDLIGHARHLLEQPDTFLQHVETSLKEYGISHAFDTPLQGGRIVRSRSCVVPDSSGNRYIGRIWLFEDVTEEHARLHEAQARANRDALTALYNRRRFDEDLERLFAQAQRNSRRLSLLYFDLDDFKRVNEEHGHAAGDRILKGIAQLLSLQSRRNEELYRLDGDEFAILVADAERHQIEALARRVITTVEKLQFSFDGLEVHVCCSMGIATCSPKTVQDSAADLMEQADIALYQAKYLRQKPLARLRSRPAAGFGQEFTVMSHIFRHTYGATTSWQEQYSA